MHSSTPQANNSMAVRLRAGSQAISGGDRRGIELRQVRLIGLVVLGIQLVVLLVWSGLEAARSVQTSDFVGFYQAWYLISHGDFNPAGWWQAQGVFIQWPLAILGLIWAHPITLLVVQDLAVVGAELVAFLFICDLVAAREETSPRLYCLTGLALLALDPWIFWSVSWDYHSEPLGILFAVLAARDLFRGRRIAWLWCFLTLLSGMVPATYLLGIGICLMLKRDLRGKGAAVGALGIVWYVVLTKLGAGKTIAVAVSGTIPNTSAPAVSSAELSARLSALSDALGHRWLDLFANLAPTGLIGVFTAPVVGIAALTLGENFSQGNPNSLVPSFQGLPLYVFVPIGTVIALMWIERRFRRNVAYALAALAVVNVVGWSAVWLPEVIPTWLQVSSSEAAAVQHAESIIPRQDGVVVSQGIVGAFADHKYIETFYGTPVTFSTPSPYTWFVIAPYAGIETAPVGQSVELIATLANNPRATLEYLREGIWVFRLRVPRQARNKRLAVQTNNTVFPAGLFKTDGRAVTRGPVSSWYVTGTNQADGPILWGDYFLRSVGRYRASTTVQGHGPVRVEVWNATTNQLLSSTDRVVSGSARITLPAAITSSDPIRSAAPVRGVALFKIDPVLALTGNYLEIRVYATSGKPLKVRTAALQLVTN